MADPAVHDLLTLLRLRGEKVPVIGADLAARNGEIVYSNAEIVWPTQRKAVVLHMDTDAQRASENGWQVNTVFELMQVYTA